jgi:UDP-N-acetylmuramate dehydrogenase
VIDNKLIRQDVSLQPYNTFGINANALYFATIESLSDFLQLRDSKLFNANELLILGGGVAIFFLRKTQKVW